MNSSRDLYQTTLALYEGLAWVKFFAKIRFWTGSFEEVASHVPAKGNILDLGCGYGIFANYLALMSPKRHIIGVDTDEQKIRFANRGAPNAEFRIGDATEISLGAIDCVLILDVLHHLSSYEAQEKLIGAIERRLSKNGILIILEVDKHPFWKLALARIVDGLLYFGLPVYYRYRTHMTSLLGKYFSVTTAKHLAHNPFPHTLYVSKKS